MKQIFLSYFPAPVLIGMALFLFLAVFVAILYRTFRRENRGIHDHLSKLPLEEDY